MFVLRNILIVLISFNSILTWACGDWFLSLKIKDQKKCISLCTTAPTDMSNYFCTNQCENLCKSNVIKKPKQPNFYDLTDDEIVICENSPIKCAKVYMLSWSAEQDCLSIYAQSRTNDESDACRHYMWSYYLHKEYGLDLARKILNAHENNPIQKNEEKNMDTHNNELSLEDHKLNIKNTNPKKALDNFKDNLKRNKLKILKPRYKNKGGLP